MEKTAVAFGLTAMLGWGIWSVLAKLATDSIAPETAMVLSYATSVAVALGYIGVFRREALSLAGPGVAFALAAGVFAGIAAVAFYAGLDAGRTSVVTTVSALYFVVAAVIGVVFLNESIGPQEVLGVGFAILALLLILR